MKRNYIIPLQRVADLEAQECLLQGQTHTSGDSWDEEW